MAISVWKIMLGCNWGFNFSILKGRCYYLPSCNTSPRKFNMDHEIVHACLLMKKPKLMKNSNDEQILVESYWKTHCAIVERLREGSNANQDTISVSRSHFLGVYTVETISSVSNTVPLKPFCQVSFWFREQKYTDLISEAEDTTHKGKWSVGDWKNYSGKSMAFREGELVFLKWWDSCEVVCNWDSTASNGNINRTKTHANHMVEVIGCFSFYGGQ